MNIEIENYTVGTITLFVISNATNSNIAKYCIIGIFHIAIFNYKTKKAPCHLYT